MELFRLQRVHYTVVGDSKVEEIISAVLDTIENNGEKGMGKIFVTAVEDVIDLGTKSRGIGAL
jgi:nitrogen regulatory protein P-II 1